MAVYNLQQYRNVVQKRIDKLKVEKIKTEIDAAKFMVNRARLRAPRKSGYLINNIRRRKNVVTSRGTDQATGFSYVHWINQTPRKESFHRLTVRPKGRRGLPMIFIDGSPVLVRGGVMVYGQSPSTWNWTGQARYFTKAAFETRGKLVSLASRALKRTLEVTA